MSANKIPSEMYEKIYDAIIAAAEDHCIEDEDDRSFGFYLEDGDWTVEGTASLPVTYEDDSFSHAFGMEVCGHFEHTYDEMPEIDEIWVSFGEDGDEAEFDYEKFNTQFDTTIVQLRDGSVIKQGDVVLVPTGYVNGWKKAIFDHYNTMTHEWCCKTMYRNGEVSRYNSHFRRAMVATEENMSKYRIA